MLAEVARIDALIRDIDAFDGRPVGRAPGSAPRSGGFCPLQRSRELLAEGSAGDEWDEGSDETTLERIGMPDEFHVHAGAAGGRTELVGRQPLPGPPFDSRVSIETRPAAVSHVYRSRSHAVLLPSVTSAHPSPWSWTSKRPESIIGQRSARLGPKSVSSVRTSAVKCRRDSEVGRRHSVWILSAAGRLRAEPQSCLAASVHTKPVYEDRDTRPLAMKARP